MSNLGEPVLSRYMLTGIPTKMLDLSFSLILSIILLKQMVDIPFSVIYVSIIFHMTTLFILLWLLI